MTTNERNNIITGYERRLKALRKMFGPKIFAALQDQVKQYRNSGDLESISFARMAKTIEALYKQAGTAEAAIEYRRWKNVKAAGFGFNPKWTAEILEYFRTNLLDKAVLPITAYTKKIIRLVLEEAAVQGLGAEETARYILRRTTDMNRNRVNRIVRTESVRAMNIGSMVGANESKIVLDKIWITARDERVRGSHRRLDNNRFNDGEPIDMADVFPNGCAFPGDPNGSGKETIQCRCRLGFVARRDAQGRIVRREVATPLVVNRGNRFSRFAEGFAAGVGITSVIDEILNSD